MTSKKVRRVSPREGYDRWAATYDGTANPLVALDERYTLAALAPRNGESILDAGCGTGRHFGRMHTAGSTAVGMDVAGGMLRSARRKYYDIPLVQADLEAPLPFDVRTFDAALCALVGEHIARIDLLFHELHAVLRPGGRAVFSVYHPDMVAGGREANFVRGNEELRLGAHGHTVSDYVNVMLDAGFAEVRHEEKRGDAELAAAIPSAAKYVNQPLLLILEARRN